MKKSKNNVVTTLLLLSVGITIFGLGFKGGEWKTQAVNLKTYGFTSNTPASARNLDFTLFWDTWNKLEQKYVDKKKLIPQKMFYGAIKGMVASVDDPYTFFLEPKENQQLKDDLGGKFEGIGAELGLKDNHITVIAPIKNSPAERAGIKSGDIVTKVNGESTRGWTLLQAVSKIRGDKGTSVGLTLVRDGKEVSLSIVRDQIYVPSIEVKTEKQVSPVAGNTTNQANQPSNQINPNVAVIKINQFGDDTNSRWDTAVDDVVQKYQNGMVKGLIVDLRDNPGGYLDSAVYLTSEFLDIGKKVVRQESTEQEARDYTVEREGRLKTIPLVVLINQGSASAAEIFSGALRDNKRAKLVGQKSFGKGSVQESLDLSKGAGLHVTVAKWILPNGEWINGKGITPDFVVDNTIKPGETLTRDQDKQLEKAIELLVK